jgi:multidrug/hemolysin transport system ATP-binding protein
MNICEVKDLKKFYGEVKAVDGISFGVSEGSLFSFLGTNGAGKSTTINILTTLLKKDSGQVIIGGVDLDKNPEEIRKLTGVVFQESVLDDTLTVRENLFVRGGLYDIKNLKNAVENAIKMTDIGEFQNRKYKNLSGGQRRRVDIARAVLHTPKILFLDEPTTGLDPKTRRDIWEMLRNLQKQQGTTVFLTTHYMEEAKDSDNVIIIAKGRIKAEGTPLELKTKYCNDILKLTLKNGEYHEFKLAKSVEALPIIAKYDNIENIEIINGTLDDVFLNLTEEING